MASLQTIIMAFIAAAAVIVLLKIWESELSITLTSQHFNRRIKKRNSMRSKERVVDNTNQDEEANGRDTKQLKD